MMAGASGHITCMSGELKILGRKIEYEAEYAENIF